METDYNNKKAPTLHPYSCLPTHIHSPSILPLLSVKREEDQACEGAPLPGKMEVDRQQVISLWGGYQLILPVAVTSHLLHFEPGLCIPQKPLLGTISRTSYSTYTIVDKALHVSLLGTEPI